MNDRNDEIITDWWATFTKKELWNNRANKVMFLIGMTVFNPLMYQLVVEIMARSNNASASQFSSMAHIYLPMTMLLVVGGIAGISANLYANYLNLHTNIESPAFKKHLFSNVEVALKEAPRHTLVSNIRERSPDTHIQLFQRADQPQRIMRLAGTKEYIIYNYVFSITAKIRFAIYLVSAIIFNSFLSFIIDGSNLLMAVMHVVLLMAFMVLGDALYGSITRFMDLRRLTRQPHIPYHAWCDTDINVKRRNDRAPVLYDGFTSLVVSYYTTNEVMQGVFKSVELDKVINRNRNNHHQIRKSLELLRTLINNTHETMLLINNTSAACFSKSNTDKYRTDVSFLESVNIVECKHHLTKIMEGIQAYSSIAEENKPNPEREPELDRWGNHTAKIVRDGKEYNVVVDTIGISTFRKLENDNATKTKNTAADDIIEIYESICSDIEDINKQVLDIKTYYQSLAENIAMNNFREAIERPKDNWSNDQEIYSLQTEVMNKSINKEIIPELELLMVGASDETKAEIKETIEKFKAFFKKQVDIDKANQSQLALEYDKSVSIDGDNVIPTTADPAHAYLKKVNSYLDQLEKNW